MIIQIGDYRIEPYNSTMCWTLKKWRKSKEKGVETWKWCETGIYPSNLETALLRVSEWLVMDSEGVLQIDEAVAELRKLREFVEKAVKR